MRYWTRFVFCLFVVTGTVSAQTRLNYRLDARPALTEPGRVHVRIEAKGCPIGDVAFMIPAWKPGHYRIEEWQNRVSAVLAQDDAGNPLEVSHKTSDRTWTVRANKGDFVALEYDTITLQASKNWLACEGPEILMYPRGATNVECSLAVDLPENWRLECSLPREKPGVQVFRAKDYDELVDSPLEIGELTVDTFTVRGVEHAIVYNLVPRFDRRAMIEMSKAIVESQGAMMGGLPYERYCFMWHLQDVLPGVFTGGLEHRASTTLYLPQRYFMNDVVEQTASLVAHEYFHLWNVKRIRPYTLGPFDYSKKVPVKSLWLLEGVTDYYADETCRRLGFYSEKRWLREVRGEIQTLYNNPAYRTESAEDASLAAFDRGYDGAGIDYYNFGKLIGLLLDIEIRWTTEGKKSLDDLMRLLYERFGPPRPGYDDVDLGTALFDVTGKDMRPWLKDYVEGTKDLPFETTFAKAGLVFKRTTTTERESVERLARLYPNVLVEARGDAENPNWIVVGDLESDDLDLKEGDEILAFDGERPRARTESRTFIGRNVCSVLRKKVGAVRRVEMTVRSGQEEKVIAIEIPTRTRYIVTTLEPAADVKDALVLAVMDGRRIQAPASAPAKK